MKKKFTLMMILSTFIFILGSCDPHVPPAIEFKTGGNYTSADKSVPAGATITVGIIGTKKEDDMKTFNVSYAYDGSQTTTTKDTFTLTGSEAKNYDKDYTFAVRTQPGVEDWYFVITDRDGNIAKLKLTLTVTN